MSVTNAILHAVKEGGITAYQNTDVDQTEDAVKTGPGRVFWIHAFNTATTPLYVKLFNAATGDVTVGSTVPKMTFGVPATGEVSMELGEPGTDFNTAITIAGTTGPTATSAAGPGANALMVSLGYA